MKKEVLVYDNQFGYYDMLKSRMKEGFEFVLFKRGMLKLAHEFDAILFFLHEDLEMIDLASLYQAKVPMILGLSKSAAVDEDENGNIYTLNLQQTKEGLINNLKAIFKKLTAIAA